MVEKQISMYDIGIDTDKRPCRYKFYRHKGQLVRGLHGVGIITNIIDAYYTEYETEDGQRYLGSPHDLVPMSDEDYHKYYGIPY